MANANDLYGGYTLKKGDNDKKKKWTGRTRNESGKFVEELQTDLKKIGVYLNRVDGDFGKRTHEAVKRFQWNAKNFTGRMKNKNYTTVTKSFSDKVDGIVGKNSKKELQTWKNNSYKATGDLVRVKFSKFSNIEEGPGFKTISHPDINDDEVVVSTALVEYLKHANEKAKDLSVDLKINQAMRLNGVKVSGAVVKPASKSQHLIGHAFDCNIIDGNSWNNSTAFANGNETENAKKFIKAMKANGMRWGGNFGNVDTPHFDKQVVASSDAYDYKYFFNQRMITEKHNIKLKTW